MIYQLSKFLVESDVFVKFPMNHITIYMEPNDLTPDRVKLIVEDSHLERCENPLEVEDRMVRDILKCLNEDPEYEVLVAASPNILSKVT